MVAVFGQGTARPSQFSTTRMQDSKYYHGLHATSILHPKLSIAMDDQVCGCGNGEGLDADDECRRISG